MYTLWKVGVQTDDAIVYSSSALFVSKKIDAFSVAKEISVLMANEQYFQGKDDKLIPFSMK